MSPLHAGLIKHPTVTLRAGHVEDMIAALEKLAKIEQGKKRIKLATRYRMLARIFESKLYGTDQRGRAVRAR